jgi:hypothetical protein
MNHSLAKQSLLLCHEILQQKPFPKQTLAVTLYWDLERSLCATENLGYRKIYKHWVRSLTKTIAFFFKDMDLAGF